MDGYLDQDGFLRFIMDRVVEKSGIDKNFSEFKDRDLKKIQELVQNDQLRGKETYSFSKWKHLKLRYINPGNKNYNLPKMSFYEDYCLYYLEKDTKYKTDNLNRLERFCLRHKIIVTTDEPLTVLLLIEKFDNINGSYSKNEPARYLAKRINNVIVNESLPITLLPVSSFVEIDEKEAEKVALKKEANIVFWGDFTMHENILDLGYFLNGLDSNQRVSLREGPKEAKYESIRDLKSGRLHLDIENIIRWVIAQQYYLSGEFKMALRILDQIDKYVDKSFELENVNYKSERLEIGFRKSVILLELEKLDKAENKMKNLLEEYQELQNDSPTICAKLLHNMGVLLLKRGIFSDAKKYFLKSNEVEEHWLTYLHIEKCIYLDPAEIEPQKLRQEISEIHQRALDLAEGSDKEYVKNFTPYKGIRSSN